MRVTFKRQKRERCVRHDRYTVSLNGRAVAAIAGCDGGWYWAAASTKSRPWRNTIAEGLPLFPDLNAAKAHCKAWLLDVAALDATTSTT